MPFKLSTRGHYAVLLMYQLARSGRSYSSLQDISKIQNISQGYLEQLVKPLRDAGLVESKRGAGGGYVLARPPQDITVGEVIRAVEGPVIPVECVGERPETDKCPTDCRARAVWQKVGQAIDNILDSITFQDLVEDGQENMKGAGIVDEQ